MCERRWAVGLAVAATAAVMLGGFGAGDLLAESGRAQSPAAPQPSSGRAPQPADPQASKATGRSSVYLNVKNITVRLGPTMAAEPFANQTTAISLANVINAPSATAPEDHYSPTTHVWVSGKPLDLAFDLGAEYDLTTLHFWNYTIEDHDVDKVTFTFFDALKNPVGALDVEPALGGRLGNNPIVAESYTLSFPTNVRYVNAVLTGTNGQVDFTNIGFTASLSDPIPLATDIGSLSVVSALRQDAKPTRNIAIILDASGSMRELLGKKTKWATALEVLAEVVAKLPADFSVGLRTYGHRLSSKDPNTCTDVELLVPVVPLNRTALLAAANGLTPRGETPLVHSILQTPADLKPVGGGTVILITDGEESCKGDFATAAAALKASRLNLTLNIVGFAMKSGPTLAPLRALAESAGGHYYGASSGEALARAVLLAAVDRLPYRILGASGKEIATGEAGVNEPHQLPEGSYTVVIMAGDQELRTPVTVVIGKPVVLRALIKGDKLVVER
jgi:hypothetical protein